MKNKIKEEVQDLGKLNQVIIKETLRSNGTVRIQQDFSNCVTMAEQHTAHMTNINYLMEKYKPDELAHYIATKNQMRREIVGHDFSKEPNLLQAKNQLYTLKKNFENLPYEIRKNFKNHVEFVKFIDNPDNQEKMIRLGLLKKEEVKSLTSDQTPTPQKEKEKSEESKKPSS